MIKLKIDTRIIYGVLLSACLAASVLYSDGRLIYAESSYGSIGYGTSYGTGYGSEDVWGRAFLGGEAPPASLGVPYNNIGVVSNGYLYSCVAVTINGITTQSDMEFRVIEPAIAGSVLALELHRTRDFNPNQNVASNGELPDCSGEMTDNQAVYSDVVSFGSAGVYQLRGVWNQSFSDKVVYEVTEAVELVSAASDWPSYADRAPSQAVAEGHNMIGYLEPVQERLYVCVNVLGEQFELELRPVYSTGLAYELIRSRVFSPGDALMSDNAPPSCSAVLNVDSSNSYSDVVQIGDDIYTMSGTAVYESGTHPVTGSGLRIEVGSLSKQ